MNDIDTLETKICSKCKASKTLDEYNFQNKKSGTRHPACKQCRKVYYNKNREKFARTSNERYKNNKAKSKDYYLENRDAILAYKSKFFQDNKERILSVRYEYWKNRKKTDPAFKLRMNCSTIIGRALKKSGSHKNFSVLKKLPYTMRELKIHLENQFESWMTWDNQGKYNLNTWNDNDPTTWKWNVDHIVPQSDLPYISMDDDNFQKCWALSNLRPLSAKQNNYDGVNRTRHTK